MIRSAMTRLLCMRLGTGQPGATLVTCILRDGSPRTQADMWSRDQCRTHASSRRTRGAFSVLGCVVLGFCESTKKGGRAEKSSHSACVPVGHCFGNGRFCAGLGV